METLSNHPKISVIIHFLNAEKYLSQAIDSVIRQTFSDWELVLVDGGSQDQSVEIAKSYQNILKQPVNILEHKGEEKLGIFSSRIWGAKEAKAPILALLDSDDEWHPQFLERHYAIYQSVFGISSGMIYCPVSYWWEDMNLTEKSYIQPSPCPGLHQPPDLLLEFIENWYHKSAANSSVMIAREIILEAERLIGTADEGAVEDQFLWSSVILKYPVFVSPEPLVRYRQWSGSTCSTTAKQGKAEKLRKRHLNWLIEYLTENFHSNEKDTLIRGIQQILESEDLYRIQSGNTSPRTVKTNVIKYLFKDVLAIKSYKKVKNLYCSTHKYLLNNIKYFIRILISRMGFGVGVEPLSYQWGCDRGVPICRYYLDQFLQEFYSDIQGHCLEFQEDTYTSRFGGNRIIKSDILHQNNTNPRATLVADLTMPNALPSSKFDCIICTHVLHVIFNLNKAISELYRILKPGGVLLVAVPHVSMCDPNWHEFWRFTPEGLQLILAEAFGKENITLRAYGNSLTTAGEFRGLVSHEFTKKELNCHNPRFALEVCARAIKN